MRSSGGMVSCSMNRHASWLQRRGRAEAVPQEPWPARTRPPTPPPTSPNSRSMSSSSGSLTTRRLARLRWKVMVRGSGLRSLGGGRPYCAARGRGGRVLHELRPGCKHREKLGRRLGMDGPILPPGPALRAGRVGLQCGKHPGQLSRPRQRSATEQVTDASRHVGTRSPPPTHPPPAHRASCGTGVRPRGSGRCAPRRCRCP